MKEERVGICKFANPLEAEEVELLGWKGCEEVVKDLIPGALFLGVDNARGFVVDGGGRGTGR